MSSFAALVTGGTGRLGRAIATRLGAEGFGVKAAERRDGDLATATGARGLVERAVAAYQPVLIRAALRGEGRPRRC